MPKIYPEKLPAHLKADLAPAYWVSGDEPLLAGECCDAIRAATRRDGATERLLYHPEKSFDWNQLHQAAENLSLFNEKKLIEIRLRNNLDDAGRKALTEYTQRPGEDTTLLLVTPKVERKSQNTQWFKKLVAGCQFIEVWPVDAGRLPQWLQQRARKMDMTLDPGALDILASRVEGNLLAAVQELEKLKLLADDGQVSRELMAQSVADSARYDIFGLVDRALYGDARGAVKMLTGLRGEGTAPAQILWALSREIRTLIQLSQALAEGKNFNSAARSLRIWDKRQPVVDAALKRLKQPRLHMLLRKAGQMDRAIKGMDDGDPWAIGLDLVLNLAGVQALDKASERLSLQT